MVGAPYAPGPVRWELSRVVDFSLPLLEHGLGVEAPDSIDKALLLGCSSAEVEAEGALSVPRKRYVNANTAC